MSNSKTVEKKQRDAFRAGVNWVKAALEVKGVVFMPLMWPSKDAIDDVVHKRFPDKPEPKEPAWMIGKKWPLSGFMYRYNPDKAQLEYRYPADIDWNVLQLINTSTSAPGFLCFLDELKKEAMSE